MCGGTAADRQHHDACTKVIGSDAGSNYHIRAAKHRVLGTLLGQPTLRITYGGRVEGRGGGRNKGVRGHGGGPPAP